MLRINTNKLALIMKSSPYRVGSDGIPRILPSIGGITINKRIGDCCVGLAVDHLEPGVSVHNINHNAINQSDKLGMNYALLAYSCVGNTVEIIDGPCKGDRGFVTGKHGGIDHLLVDFPTKTLIRLNPLDQLKIYTYGLGLQLLDFPEINIYNCSPLLIKKWNPIKLNTKKLLVPVTYHISAANVMGSGVGSNNPVQDDCDIQLINIEIKNELKHLRFGDFIAVDGLDTRYGCSNNEEYITVGVVVHSNSQANGHGPGLLSLLTARKELFKIKITDINLKNILGVK
jgi:hypothetical protein